jgi:hypothetical protein
VVFHQSSNVLLQNLNEEQVDCNLILSHFVFLVVRRWGNGSFWNQMFIQIIAG